MSKHDRLHDENYKILRKRVVTEMGKAKFEDKKHVDMSLTSNISCKKLWKMAKSPNNCQINFVNNSLIVDGNNILIDNLEKANLFNTSFVSQSHLEDQLPSKDINPNH